MARLDPRVKPLAAGRALFGTVALVAAGPLCRWTGITDRPRVARSLGVAIFTADALLVANVLRASEGPELRAAARLNATTDLAGAAVLLALAGRRSGMQRLTATLAGASLVGGGLAWLNLGRDLRR